MKRSTKFVSQFVAFVTTLTVVTAMTAHPASAVMGCGQFSLPLDGTVLDSSEPIGGPYEFELDAGVYDLIFQSTVGSDSLSGAGQWNVILDSGQVSPATSEIETGDTYVIDVFEGELIDVTTSLTIHHVSGEPVVPVCIGFTPAAQPNAIAGVSEPTETVPRDSTPPAEETSAYLTTTDEELAVAMDVDVSASMSSDVEAQRLTTSVDSNGRVSVFLLVGVSLIAAGVLVVSKRGADSGRQRFESLQPPKFRIQ